MNKILVIAPHPDDETLGVGGTLLKHKQNNDSIAWLIVTSMLSEQKYDEETILRRKTEIDNVHREYAFNNKFELCFPTSKLDTVPINKIIDSIDKVFKLYQPHTLYLPHAYDVHSDHTIAHRASISCTKWFRNSSIRRILSYETLSETEIAPHTINQSFTPNVYVDITAQLENKIEILNIYQSELGEFPFPRSAEAVRSLASFRGSACGYIAAESFMLLKEIL